MPISILRRRTVLVSFAFTALLLLAGAATAIFAVCVPTAYTVTSSAPPAIANWTTTVGVWQQSGGFPGCAPGDTASDTNASPTTLIINNNIPNPIIGLALNCNGCVIDIQSGGSLTLAGGGNVASGAKILVSGGTLTIASSGTLTFQSGSTFQQTGGTVDVQTGGQLTAGGTNTVSGGTLQVSGGHLNLPSGTLPISSGAQFLLSDALVDGSGAVFNGGTMIVSGVSTTFGAYLDNNPGGTVEVQSGTLHVTTGGDGDAPFLIDSGATLDFTSFAGYTMTANGTVSGAGTLSVTGNAELTIGGVTAPNAFTMMGGTLDGAGFLTTNTLLWTGGTFSGSGGTQINGGGSGTFTGAAGAMTLDGRAFNDYGYVSYTATANPLTLVNGGTFSIYGTFDIQSNGSIADGGGGSNSFVVAPNGFLIKSGGTGTSTISPPSTNTATVLAATGTLNFAGDGSHSGAFFADSGATLAFSASSTDLAGFVSGDGTFSFPSGFTSLSGSYAPSGLTSITGGYVSVSASASTVDFTLTSGTLNLQNQFTITGTGTWSGGTMSGSSVFDVASGATLTIDCASGSTSLSGAQLTNDGTVDYTCSVAGGNELTLVSATISNNGVFDIQTDQPILTGILASSLPRHGSPSFILIGSSFITNNSGATFEKSAGSGTTDVDPIFTNNGTVLALSGTMNFTNGYTQNSGETTLGPGGISVTSALQLSGGVLDGAGTLTGDLQNDANVSPGGSSNAGTIDVTGNYTQGAGGTLTIELAGASSFDQLAVGGSTTLAGTLDASLINSYVPSNGATFPVTTFASRTGDFTVKNLPTFSGTHGSFTASYTPTELDLTAVVTPSQTDLSPVMNGPANVNAASALSYTIDVTNGGADPTSGTTTVADTLPAGVTGASGSGTGWSCGAPSGGVITCTSTDVIASSSAYPTLTISMTAPVNGGGISNSATVSSANDPNGANNTASAGTTVIAQADLQVVKSGSGGVTAGQNVVYTVVVTNNGPSSASNVVVTDPTPANLTFLSNGGACTGVYPCSLGTLANGQSATITSTYSTSGSFSGNVTNTATVSSTTADPNNTNDSSSKTTNIGAQADLSIGKSGPSSANVGSNIVYTINFANAGPSPATNVVISDPTPVGLAFLSNSGACTTAFPCNIGTLASGGSGSITSTYTIPANYTGVTIANTATISATENDPNPGDNNGTANTNVAQPADVSITKTGPTSSSPGQNVTYVITVTNGGPASAGGVTVDDPTPFGLNFVSNTGACTSAFPCSLGTMTPGQTATINATFSIPANFAGSSVTNTATVASGASDPSSGNNTASATTSLVPQADVGILKSGPASTNTGQNIVYTTTVTNHGPLTASNVFVTDGTPAGLSFVSNSGACSGSFPCALGALTSGQSVTITSTYNVPSNYSGASITNTANVSTSTFDGNASNDSSTVTTAVTVGAPSADLRIIKSGPAQVSGATQATFTIAVTNLGPSAATNVVVTDPTPSGIVFTSTSGACTNGFPCTIPSLAAGATATINATYTVPAQTHGTVTNTAHVTSSTSDPVAANNSSSASMNVLPFVTCPGSAPQLNAPAANATVTSPVSFSWNGVPGATSYTLSISGGGNPPVSVTTANTSTSVSLSSGSYSWSVTATGAFNCVAMTSAARPLTVCNLPAATVASVVGESTTGQTYSVQWTAVGEAASYELQEAGDNTFTNATSFPVNGLTRAFTKNAVNATPFFYRVRPVSSCGQPGPFSTVVSVVVIPLPKPGDPNINVNVPNGSTTPVTFQVLIPGLPGGTTSFIATVDKPWLSVLPSAGLVPPEGVLVTISEDPSSLTNGTWTGTLIVAYGSSAVTGRAHTEATTSTAIPLSISLVTPVTPGGFSTPSASALIIPSVGHIAGTSTSSWRSDIRIANVSSTPRSYLLLFNPGTGDTSTVKQTSITVAPGGTTALDDIVRNWFGVGSLGDSLNGVLTIQQLDNTGHAAPSSLQSFVSSRTYNATSGGTFGQFIPSTPFSAFIGKGSSVLSLQQLAQSATFHTNLGLIEASGKPASAAVSVFDGAGTKLLDLPVSLAGGEQKQLNSFLAQNGISTDNGRVEVRVVGGDGHVTSYASVIDSNSSDPLLVSGVPLGGNGASRFVVPGVAALDTGIANWRSDVRIFNSGVSPQTTTLTLYPLGGGDAKTQSVTVNPAEVKALDNVVQSLFGASNLGGALHVTTATDSPLVVTARTYDQTSHGTLGQFVPAVTLADSVGSGDRSLQILQVEDSARFRTNVGIAELNGKPAIVEVSVTLPDSRITPKVQIALGAYESTQLPILSSLGLGATYNARIAVRVIDGDGKVAAYGSVIDMTTQDATYIPAQ
jgi:uncharacterized repeat protein (TIGR01451 family)